MNLYTKAIRPVLFRCDPEWIHDRAIQAGHLAGGLPPVRAALRLAYGFTDPRLQTEVCGLHFANPLGLAAGFDKSGKAIRAIASVGFGHVEIGSISAQPSVGNPKPRLWRLIPDRGILVHYGLPNDGADAVAAHLARVRLPVPLGINIVKTNRGLGAAPDSAETILADYVHSVRTLEPCGDYLSLNLSCPNTEMGRDFFADPPHLQLLFDALAELAITKPLFLKMSPLGGVAAIERLLEAAAGYDFISGFVFNLAPGKPAGLRTPDIDDLPGATAGKPIEAQMNECITETYRRMDRTRYRIIGIGGVFTAEDAYRKIQLGASLVQLMTAMIYEGPGVLKRINRGLIRLLERDGLTHIAQAVGTGNQV